MTLGGDARIAALERRVAALEKALGVQKLRPRCKCHGLEKLSNGTWKGRQMWKCPVAKRLAANRYAARKRAVRKSIQMEQLRKELS